MQQDTVFDPLVLTQKEYLSQKQAKVIDVFVSSGKLPQRVNDFFASSIQALLKNYESVVIEVEDLIRKPEQLPPMDEIGFKQKLNKMASGYTKGKDTSTLRIVVKQTGNGE